MNHKTLLITTKNFPFFLQIDAILIGISRIIMMFLMLWANVGILAYINILSISIYAFCTIYSKKLQHAHRVYQLYLFEIMSFSTVMSWCIQNNCHFSVLCIAMLPFTGLIYYILEAIDEKENIFHKLRYLIGISIVFMINTIHENIPHSYGITIPNEQAVLALTFVCIGCELVFLLYSSIAFFSITIDNSQKLNEKFDKLSIKLVLSLTNAVDAKDHYTKGHSFRVANYAKKIGEKYGLSAEEQNSLYYCGLLHDIGKIGISDSIINKTEKLTEEEYTIIKMHPIIGANILQEIDDFPVLSVGAKWHHERYDGKGYPNGLSGEDIPLYARIICVADAYDTMTSKRTYHDILAQDIVRNEIEKGRGSQFDPQIADIMLEIIRNDKDYTLHA